MARVSSRIGDLYVDLQDGQNHLKLLDVLSEERLIEDITIKEVDNKETKSAKDALLLWCHMKTASFSNVNIRNLTTSWRDGLAFNAIIHKHRPDLITYVKLYNFNNAVAFNTTKSKLGLTKLLDAEDVFVEQPDKKSIITYVVTYYHFFSKLKQETVEGKRISKFVGIAMENDRMIKEYGTLTSDLFNWIEITIDSLGGRNFAKYLVGIQQQLAQFNNYRTVGKPPKFDGKGNLEVLLFTIQSKMRDNHQTPFTPREGKLIWDINKAWERLDKAEHERELALREKLIRQKKLEQLATRFNRNTSMRETWLSENQRLVSQGNFGFDLPAVKAAAKKHEAIVTEIFTYEERVPAVVAVAQELEAETYHDIERIYLRKKNVMRLWEYLLELLRARRLRLEASLQLQQGFQEMLYILDTVKELEMRLLSDDYGKNLMGVEDLLQKHSLFEADINVLGDRVKAFVTNSQRFISHDEPVLKGFRPADPATVIERVQQLEEAYAEHVKLAIERRTRLEESKKLWQFYWDMVEEENLIKAKENILLQGDTAHDFTAVHLQDVIDQQQFGAEKVQDRLQEIINLWQNLNNMADYRKRRLTEAVDYHQFFADADDVDTWMLDKLRLVSSEDFGRDETNVQSLLKKHEDVTDELNEYTPTIDQLHQQAGKLGEQHLDSPEVVKRSASIDRRFKELTELAKLRKQRLLDAVVLYKLLSEAEDVEQWVAEKYRMLLTMVPAKDIDVEILKHRYDGFEKEIISNANRVAVANKLARQLPHVEHPNCEEILARQNQLNSKWSELRKKAEGKRDKLNSAHGVQKFYIECRETVAWSKDKKRILEETANLEMDLTGIMTFQRRLSGMERDLAAIEVKLDALEREADRISEDHPEVAVLICKRIDQIRVVWDQLKASVSILMQKKQIIETEMAVKAKQVTELEFQSKYLSEIDPDKVEDMVAKKCVVENRIDKLKKPSEQCKAQLEKKKEAYQFRGNVDGEKLWIGEKMPHAASFEIGNSLHNVHNLKKNQWNEIKHHEPRIYTIFENGEKLMSELLNSDVDYLEQGIAEREELEDFVVKMRRRKPVRLAFPNSKGGVSYPPKKNNKDQQTSTATTTTTTTSTATTIPAKPVPKGPPAANTNYCADAIKIIREKQNNHNCPYCFLPFTTEGLLCIHIQQKCLKLPQSPFFAKYKNKSYPSKLVSKYNGGVQVAALSDFLCALEPDDDTYLLPADLVMFYNNNYLCPLRIRSGTPFSKDVPYSTYNDHLRAISQMQERIHSKTLKHVIIPVLFGTYCKPKGHILNETYWRRREHASMILASLNEASGLFEFTYYDSFEEDDMYLKAVKSDKLRFLLSEMFMQKAITISNFHVFQSLSLNGCGTCVCHWAFQFVKTGVVADPQSPGTIDGLKRRLHDSRRQL